MKIVTILLCIVSFGSAYSQEFSNLFEYAQEKTKSTDGEIIIYQSDEIFKIVNDHAYKTAHSKTILGYKVRIFSNSSSNARELAIEQKSRFMRMHPEMAEDFETIDLKYDTPFFKLYVGSFRRKHEALKLLHQIRNEFPGAFIVNTYIDLPKQE